MSTLNYGVIGNCRTAALVSAKGSIEWCCLPDFDSPSVFSKILDESKGGSFGILPVKNHTVTQRYLGYTNILITTFESEDGGFEIIDFMPRYKTGDHSYFAPPEIFRYIKLLHGNPEISINYSPKLNYAAHETSHIVHGNFIRTFSGENPTDCIFLYSGFDLNDILKKKTIILRGDQYMLLSYNQKLIEIDLNRVILEFERTKVYWLNWSNRSLKHEKYNDEITRSLLVLKAMSFQPTGAMLAALTTSIPESPGDVRNWDYRFCWLRDASMSIETLFRMGHPDSAHKFLQYIKGILRTKSESFQIMYGIRGEKELTEKTLDHLAGFRGSKPVRIGNAAYSQRQNDVFGYLLNVICQYYRNFPGNLDEIEEMWEIVRNIARTVITHWEKPDKGIWEMRNEEHHYVFSKIMSWVAMDRASSIAGILHRAHYAEMWRSLADEIKKDVIEKGWNEELQTFTQAYDNNNTDASLLLMAEYGFVSYDDPKYIKTVGAIEKTLLNDGLMYRYLTNDDFGKPSTSFTICTFWMIQALYKTGKRNEAENLFTGLMKCSNHLGLFSEDIDFVTREQLGNFPQAYSHLALINTAALFTREKHISKFIRP